MPGPFSYFPTPPPFDFTTARTWFSRNFGDPCSDEYFSRSLNADERASKRSNVPSRCLQLRLIRVPSSAKNRHHQKWSSPIVRMNPYLTAGIIGRQVHAAKSQSHSTQYLLLRRVLGARAEVWRLPLDNFRRLG